MTNLGEAPERPPSERLGHASVQITLDRYGHLMDQGYDQLEATLFGDGQIRAAIAKRVVSTA